MKLKYNPLQLIFTRGDAATKLACLEFFGLRDSPQAKECLLNLRKQQRANGTFPSRLDPQNWGMRETVRNTLLLLKAELPSNRVNIDSAVNFILNQQNPDGGWGENHSLKIPPEMVELSSKRSVTWLTADIVELLHQVDMEERTEYKKAVEWLKAIQNPHGGWLCFSGDIGEKMNVKGDPDSTAQITFMMGEIFGEDDPAYLKGKKLFEMYLDDCVKDIERGYRIRLRDGEKEKLDVYHLTHLLLSSLVDPPRRLQSGYDISDPRVKRMMETLIDIQLEDGGWRPFWAEESSLAYTLLAVKVLILSGAIAREDLQIDVKTYAG